MFQFLFALLFTSRKLCQPPRPFDDDYDEDDVGRWMERGMEYIEGPMRFAVVDNRILLKINAILEIFWNLGKRFNIFYLIKIINHS